MSLGVNKIPKLDWTRPGPNKVEIWKMNMILIWLVSLHCSTLLNLNLTQNPNWNYHFLKHFHVFPKVDWIETPSRNLKTKTKKTKSTFVSTNTVCFAHFSPLHSCFHLNWVCFINSTIFILMIYFTFDHCND